MEVKILQNECESYFLYETPVSTVLNIYIYGTKDEKQNSDMIKKFIKDINKGVVFNNTIFLFNFYGEKGLYMSRTRYSEYVKNKCLRIQIKKFEKENPEYKIYFMLSKPIYFPETNFTITEE